MCLDLNGKKNRKKKLAWGNITCYKYLIETYDGIYLTPFQLFEIKLGEEYTAELIKHKYNEFYSAIHEGIHSLANINDTKHLRNRHMDVNVNIRKYVIIKCVIPRFSWYYVGKFSELKSYASNKLKYVEIINE